MDKSLPQGGAAADVRPVSLTAKALAALGIVFGDLGTSPLYAYHTILRSVGGHPSAQDALGLLSLVVWALLITISLKYCVFVMRADNHGEGGVLALMALVTGPLNHLPGRRVGILVAMGLLGAALIYGDGVITPAISVLSALEGINVVSGAFTPYVLPAASLILITLFAAQGRGTARIGHVFGPVMLVWFSVIAFLGLAEAAKHPEVIKTINPIYAIGFLASHGLGSFVALGGVFLAITGGEALYADMGHFGRLPIRLSWYCFVLPALLLNYAGQTALTITDPALDGNPFFMLAPGWAIIPLVVLATLATIIASQAIITGAFSLTRQAMQLGWFPGMSIHQTSGQEYGQIYVPFVNWAMMIGTLVLTWGFGSSEHLAGAYGAAVSTTMLFTTALLFNAMRDIWKWPLLASFLVAAILLIIDLAFFAANALKLPDGGWIPLLLGALLYVVMTTWHMGAHAVRQRLTESEQSPSLFVTTLEEAHIPRVPGSAAFLSHSGMMIPSLMVRHVAQIRSLHETAIILNVHFEEIPRIPAAERVKAQCVAQGLWRIAARFGFTEAPDLTAALQGAREEGCPLVPEEIVYFGANDEVVRSQTVPRLPAWRRILFAFMYRNAVRAPDRFDLPADRFIEIRRQIQL
jgi:KUP system potassium uptake protein